MREGGAVAGVFVALTGTASTCQPASHLSLPSSLLILTLVCTLIFSISCTAGVRHGGGSGDGHNDCRRRDRQIGRHHRRSGTPLFGFPSTHSLICPCLVLFVWSHPRSCVSVCAPARASAWQFDGGVLPGLAPGGIALVRPHLTCCPHHAN